jgi:hypothetical protein
MVPSVVSSCEIQPGPIAAIAAALKIELIHDNRADCGLILTEEEGERIRACNEDVRRRVSNAAITPPAQLRQQSVGEHLAVPTTVNALPRGADSQANMDNATNRRIRRP